MRFSAMRRRGMVLVVALAAVWLLAGCDTASELVDGQPSAEGDATADDEPAANGDDRVAGDGSDPEEAEGDPTGGEGADDAGDVGGSEGADDADDAGGEGVVEQDEDRVVVFDPDDGELTFGTEIPDEFPDEMPLPEVLEVPAASAVVDDDGTHVMANVTTGLTPDELIEFLTEEVASAEWEVTEGGVFNGDALPTHRFEISGHGWDGEAFVMAPDEDYGGDETHQGFLQFVLRDLADD